VSGWQEAPAAGLDFEVRLDAPDGKLLGKGTMPVPQKGQRNGITHVTLEPAKDNQFHKLYFIYKPKNDPLQAAVSMLQFGAK